MEDSHENFLGENVDPSFFTEIFWSDDSNEQVTSKFFIFSVKIVSFLKKTNFRLKSD